MAQRTTLTEQQVDILRWIADGCPDGVMPEVHHRISAAALRRRGLVKVVGGGPTWRATVTAAGADYLKQVDSPEPPKPRQANMSLTQQLIDDLVAAGGVLRVPRPAWHDRDAINYEHRARLAEQHGKVPAGMWLTIERHRDEIELRLEDLPDGLAEAPAELTPVPVPERVARYHSAACRFRDRKAEHQVSQSTLRRSVRIIHAIAVEAQRRGWKASPESGGSASIRPGSPYTSLSKSVACIDADHGKTRYGATGTTRRSSPASARSPAAPTTKAQRASLNSRSP